MPPRSRKIVRLNILQASLLAMCRAVARLPAPPASLALVDGDRPPALPCSVRCVVGGDGLSLSIAAASIVAKVLRDRAMVRLGGPLSGLRLARERGRSHALSSGGPGPSRSDPAPSASTSARSASLLSISALAEG